MLDKATIFKIVHGSNMYGTATPTSDLDMKEVHLPSGRSIVLMTAKNAVVTGPEKENGAKNQAGDLDSSSFALHKLFDMLIQGDIIGMELIFTPKESIVFKDPRYDLILDNKDIFLSKNVRGYVSYCRRQAGKYGVRGSRVASVRSVIEFLKPIAEVTPSMKLFEVQDELVRIASENDFCSIMPIQNGSTNQVMLHLECCDRKVPFTNSALNALNIYQRVFDEYGKRALMAEKNEGVDWKAMSHAVRVGEQAIELLSTGSLTFPRPNAERLLKIKRGEFHYKLIAEELEDLLVRVEDASAHSSLPEEADKKRAEELLATIYREQVCGCSP